MKSFVTILLSICLFAPITSFGQGSLDEETSADLFSNGCTLVEKGSFTRHYKCPAGSYVKGVQVLSKKSDKYPVVVVTCVQLALVCE